MTVMGFMSSALGRVAAIVPIAALFLAAAACGNGDTPAPAPASKSDEPEKYTKALVEQALRRYEAEGREATVAYYNNTESIDGQWYVFIIDETGFLVSNAANPDRLGENLKGSAGTDVTGYYFGDDMLAAAAEGGWVDFTFKNPETGQEGRKHSWVVRHDGLIFGSGWYE